MIQKGHFGNLCINLDPINFGILFFPTYEKYCIIIYISINLPLCLNHGAIGSYLGTHILTTILLATQNVSISLSSPYNRSNEGPQTHSRYFLFPSFSHLLLPFFFPSSSSLSLSLKILHGSLKPSLESQDY